MKILINGRRKEEGYKQDAMEKEGATTPQLPLEGPKEPKCCSDLQGIRLSPQQHYGELPAAPPHLHRGLCGIRAAALALGLV